jgi:hypothetical protein
MHPDLIMDADRQRIQVGPDPRDYVLRYSAGDYDCYHLGRYIGSRPTLPKAIEVIEHEQAKAARHHQISLDAHISIATYRNELCACAARLHDLAGRIAVHPPEYALTRSHLTLAHIRIAAALRSVRDAEQSLGIAGQVTNVATRLDAAASLPHQEQTVV